MDTAIDYTAPKGTTVSVFTTWDTGREIGDDIRTAARRGEVPQLRKLYREAYSEAYNGSFDLSRDANLEELFLFLQNDQHAEGWVKATGAQDGWHTPRGGSSLSVGDMLEFGWADRPQVRRFVVAMCGFVDVTL